ncbi:hypothetical protein FRZ06_13260 [Anoxybacterium hadale]|uniref:Uncharacterized protein n=1 Tax=Anoxybacterium hadale TaxID=3408580 RepID=A0ACD1AD87_9FIRM|nr:hypothetical protein FRZ06_13260 [Clostridiales bacterium]
MLAKFFTKRFLAQSIIAFIMVITLGGCGNSNHSDGIPNDTPAGAEESFVFDPDNYESVSFDNLARTPDDFNEKRITLSGRVDVIGYETEDEVQCVFHVDDDYKQSILIAYVPDILDSRVLDEDYFTIYGYSVGIVEYKTAIGGVYNLPCVIVEKIEY